VSRFEALSRHPLAIAGALITTASAAVFIALVIAEFVGLLENPYSGLVVFIALPAIFLLGLLLIPLGMWLQQRKLQHHPDAPAGWPIIDFSKPVVRRRTLIFVALTSVNVIILLLAINFIAIGAGVGYLKSTGHLDRDRVMAIKDILFPPPAPEAAPATAEPAAPTDTAAPPAPQRSNLPWGILGLVGLIGLMGMRRR